MPMNQRLMRPRASGFDPRSIAGLELWLDFGDSSTVTLSGSTISQINDKSGKGWAAVQATGASQPTLTTNAINGRSVASFDGSNDQLTIASFPAITALSTFAVVYRDWPTRTAYRTAWAQSFASNGTAGISAFVHAQADSTTNWLANDILVFGNGWGAGRDPRAIGPLGTRASNQPVVLSAVLSSTASGAWADGTLISTRHQTTGPVNCASGTLRVGSEDAATGFSDYKIGELLIFTTPLSTFDRQRVEGYLAWKYGRQAQLPYSHPYYGSFPGYGSQSTENAALARDASGNVIQPVTYSEGGIDYVAHTFTTSGTLEFRRGVTVDYLIVAGGGGGRYNLGGGGGGGGVLTGQLTALAQSYPVVVGAGGLGGAFVETSGSNSSAFSQTAVGGGQGQGANSGNFSGMNGGSGGGSGGRTITGDIASGGSGTAGQGNAGGGSLGQQTTGGGGGGATQAGKTGSSTQAASGGAGLTSTLSGQSLVYGSGGGGGGTYGGDGGDGAGRGGITSVRTNSAAVAGRGGGGGGGRGGEAGGAAGSGTVIVRYAR